MEEKHIILIKFNSRQEGLDFLASSSLKFKFTDGNNIYDINGDIISITEDYETFKTNEIYLGDVKMITNNVLEGDLFIEDNLIKYIK